MIGGINRLKNFVLKHLLRANLRNAKYAAAMHGTIEKNLETTVKADVTLNSENRAAASITPSKSIIGFLLQKKTSILSLKAE